MKPEAIVIHHEGASNGFNAVKEYHRKKWNFESSLGYYAGYHYYIGLDGFIYVARKEDEEGAHTLGGWNRKSVGICLRGHLGLQMPTEAQENALQGLVDAVQLRWNIPDEKIYAHKELWPTECPGQYGMELVEKVRETEPELMKLQKQIDVIKEAIERLKVALSKLLGK